MSFKITLSEETTSGIDKCYHAFSKPNGVAVREMGALYLNDLLKKYLHITKKEENY